MLSALLLVLASIGVAVSPWVWMVFRSRSGTQASIWGSLDASTARVRELSENFVSHLRGRFLWVYVLCGIAATVWLFLLLTVTNVEPFGLTIAFTCCWLTSSVALTIAWTRLGRNIGVSPGLMANFFITGGLLGASFALVLNSAEISGWKKLSPNCNNLRIRMTPDCNFAVALMWILTPGLVEETFKSVWLFFRLRQNISDVPERCCFVFPSYRTRDCGCWYKLAPTPYHVVLCALASGAGFETCENVIYLLQARAAGGPAQAGSTPEGRILTTAFGRLFTSGMHMIWTGLIGLGLSRRLFLPRSQQPWLISVLLPSMLAHGLFDYSLTAVQASAEAQEAGLELLLPLSFPLVVVVTSCCLFGQQTGCHGRCWCGDSCCCAPGFWESIFGSSETSAGNVAVGLPVRVMPLMPVPAGQSTPQPTAPPITPVEQPHTG